MKTHFTIGMAGHIDHGKTTLTKALTGVDTDRLKEEKERSISIEPGYAPFIQEEKLQVSIVDVPGHERFIRQMIAGVAGIDMVMLVIAADEGVMPQTKEHLHILSLLGMKHGVIVITKIDRADEELLDVIQEDIKENVKDTFLENAPLCFVDSVSGKGIDPLRKVVTEKIMDLPIKNKNSSFRLPIDQVFTVKGQGVVVRGTIFDGGVTEGTRLKVLPSEKEVRVRQIQSHNEQKKSASAGQRTAINLGGINHEELTRGDVLVEDEFYSVSDRLDVVLYSLKNIRHRVKQRLPIKFHVGTSEVMGRVIFFDRNEIQEKTGEVFCQIELDEKVVVTRGDRFILRRATPIETLGGGWVIDPTGEKYRFGEQTVEKLKQKKEGSVSDRLTLLFERKSTLTFDEIAKNSAISKNELGNVKKILIEIENNVYTLHSTIDQVKRKVISIMEIFHSEFPMRIGINKAEIISELKSQYTETLINYVLNVLQEEKEIKIIHQYVAFDSFIPRYPKGWRKKLEHIEATLEKQGAEVDKWLDLLDENAIPSDIQKEFYTFLLQSEKAYVFDEERLIMRTVIDRLKEKLATHTERKNFNLQTARETLQLSRKNLVPLLELFDELGYTNREGNERSWI